MSFFFTWFQDGLFRRLIKNAGILFSGNAIAALFGLGSVTLTARALGPELFGIFVLIQTYVLVVNSLVSFQSWQALIKYGAEALQLKRNRDFKRLVKLGTLLDVGTAAFGTSIAAVAVVLVGRWEGWSQQVVAMTALYSVVILFSLIGTPTAILRLFGRFKAFAVQQIVASGVRFLGVIVIFFLEGRLWGFLFVWMFTEILSHTILLIMAWMELRRQGYKGIFSATIGSVSRRFPGLWRFFWFTSLNASVKQVGREVDLLLVGTFIGIEATGIYKIVKYFTKVMAQVTDPLDQSIYPDLARLWVDGAIEKFRSFILRIGAITGGVGILGWLGFVVMGRGVIDLTVGSEYRTAYVLMVIYMAPFLLYMFGVGFRSAMFSMNKAGRVLQIHIVAYACYFVALPFLLHRLELVGAALAQVVFQSIWFTAMLLSIRNSVRQGTAMR